MFHMLSKIRFLPTSLEMKRNMQHLNTCLSSSEFSWNGSLMFREESKQHACIRKEREIEIDSKDMEESKIQDEHENQAHLFDLNTDPFEMGGEIGSSPL